MSGLISLTEAKGIIRRIIDKKQKQPVLLVGESGIGKSSIVKDLSQEADLPLEDVRLAQHEPADLTGIPYREGDLTLWGRPSILRKDRFILFFDEINRGPIESRNAVFQTCTEWRIQTHELHPETVIVAAINPPESKTRFQVEMLDPAMTRRFLVLHVDITAEEWLKWASSKGIPQSILSFIHTNKKWLNQPPKDSQPFPCPATWTALGRLMDAKDEDSFIMRIGAGLVGEEATVSFVQYYRNKYDPALEALQVLREFDKVKEKLEKQTNDQHYQTSLSIVSEIERRAQGTGKLMDTGELDSFLKYLKSVPKEFVAGIFPQLGKNHKFLEVYNSITKDKYISEIGSQLTKYLGK